eukprot:CAMPEP_0114424046 /NCGR_PEP_ID=MMETSP0103-20121206/6480_1 /TAXON_ID=37642 ORGANISM="Paraphysomonas imperforata, Strain PA2" /NCGR_SAMPLE_ID=MMETSP0103 /ASSEMBLY_ACC=CAM_ASM_000201 /LENGTH=158 /DNA_ID=CAMNT_0001592763 /DNA_START=158 /DNA_END=631 /DNA_ORIENTATION=-
MQCPGPISILNLSAGGRSVSLEVLDGLAATHVGHGEGHADAAGKEGEDAGHLLVSGEGAARVQAPRLAGGLAASVGLHASDVGSGEDADGSLLLVIAGDLAHHALTLVADAHTLATAANALGPLKVKGRDGAAHAKHRHKVTNIHTSLLLFVSHFVLF